MLPGDLKIELDQLFEMTIIWIAVNKQRNWLCTALSKVCGELSHLPVIPGLFCWLPSEGEMHGHGHRSEGGCFFDAGDPASVLEHARTCSEQLHP